ncbi:WD40 repeat domain-containing protein [Kitasatospora nipponensis]|uniref:WD40 repeat domain-containing protein n=1 Tax=Kitasatospora nipponensis TaxID=258049 RepID=UPI0031DA5FEA
MTDPAWLVHAEPERVVAALDGAVGPEEVLAAAVYRASGHLHRDAGARVRRQVLALDAARYGDRELAAGLADVTIDQDAPDPWVVRWATGTGLDSRLRYAWPAPAEVGVVATVVLEGRGLAVAGCEDGTLHWWDPATGEKLGTVVADHTGEVRALVAAAVDGRPVAVTAGSDGTVRVWDLDAGEEVARYHPDGDSRVTALALARVEGRPVVVGCGTDGTVRMWDPAARARGGELPVIRAGIAGALAAAEVDGRPVAVTGHNQGAIRTWDLITGREFGARGDHTEDLRSGSESSGEGGGGGTGRVCGTMQLEARTRLLATDPTFASPLAVSANAHEAYLWDLATGERVGEPLPGFWFAQAAALTVCQGRPAALVAFDRSGPVELLDLSARKSLHPPLTGHHRTVRAVATAVVRGRHLAVTGGEDRSVRIWDLDGEREPTSRPTGPEEPVRKLTTAVLDGRPVMLTYGSDTRVRIRDLDGGGQLGEPVSGPINGLERLTVGTVDGRPTLITRDRARAVRIWDLGTRDQLHGRSTSEYASLSITFFAAVGGRFVGVTSEGRVWDLTASAWIGVQPKQWGALALTTVGGRDLVLTGRGAQEVRLWDLATGEPVGPPLTGHGIRVLAGAVGMLDGRLVAAAGAEDGAVRVWDATTGRPLGTYAFPAGVSALEVTPDGRLVVGFGPDIAVLAHR